MYAGGKRTDIDDLQELLKNKGTKLYRGTGLTNNEVQKYRDFITKKELRWNRKTRKNEELPALMALTGFISTSMDRAQAETFAWSTPTIEQGERTHCDNNHKMELLEQSYLEYWQEDWFPCNGCLKYIKA